MRQYSISSAKAGMTRLRNKGGAANDSFYTLKDCYVTADRSVVPRPGTVRDEVLPAGLTKGFMMFRDRLYVFSSEPQTISDPKYVCMVLQHPDPASTAQLYDVYFAQPFLGFPYVVASFDDDPNTFYHYWLQDTGSWEAVHTYMLNNVVQPTTPNGYTYSAGRLNPADPVWSSGTPVTVGMKIEPTVFNGYYYEVIDTAGDNPITGATEPAWIATDGAVVYEDVDGTGGGGDSGGSSSGVPADVTDRYSNQGGSGATNTRGTGQ